LPDRLNEKASQTCRSFLLRWSLRSSRHFC
jgi:hypothetical protein